MAVEKRAFTLIEVLLTVVLLGIFAIIAIPRLNYAVISKQKADTTAKMIATDIRRARSLAIVNAAANTAGFALNMVGSAPYHSCQIVNLSNSAIIDTIALDPAINCSGGNSFQFGPLGNRLTATTSLTVSAQGKIVTINIISATGMVKCTEN